MWFADPLNHGLVGKVSKESQAKIVNIINVCNRSILFAE
jgi:hypothetical protein